MLLALNLVLCSARVVRNEDGVSEKVADSDSFLTKRRSRQV
jgi:hypothetical protein